MRIVVAVALALAVVSCSDKGRPGKHIDQKFIDGNLLAAPPASLVNHVDANLGGKVIYLGNEVDSTTLTPGGSARIVHYWKVVEPPGADYAVFAHLVGPGKEWVNVDYSDMRVGYPPAKWKAGDIIRDEQKFALDAGWQSPWVELRVGLYQQGQSGGGARLPVTSGPADQENRVIAFRFKVDLEHGPAAHPEYLIRKARGPITLDGVASEADWKNAPYGPDFTDAQGSPPMGEKTHAKLLWDDHNLYAFIEVEDDDVASPYTHRDDTLWKADVVELFIDADRNQHGYVELQVNPHGAMFDSWFPATRGGEKHFEWNSGMQNAVVVHGTIDAHDDHDDGWDVELAIPLADVKGMDAAMKIAIPPAIGDRWRLNVVRGDQPVKGALRAASWNPITYQDFHALGRMLTVVFADADGNATVAPPVVPAPVPVVPVVPAPAPKPAAGSKPAPKPAAASKPAG